MAREFLDIDDVPTDLSSKVKQDLKFKTGRFVWRVKFNTPLDPSSINKDTMYITDMNNVRRPAFISYDPTKNQIEVEPINAYAEDVYYHLHITTRVRSIGGQSLKQPVKLKFKL